MQTADDELEGDEVEDDGGGDAEEALQVDADAAADEEDAEDDGDGDAEEGSGEGEQLGGVSAWPYAPINKVSPLAARFTRLDKLLFA